MPKSDLLARILETPLLAQVVPQLPPEVLHKVIQHCGLEDAGEIVALATPAQLMRVFDLDLWRSGRPGLDEQLDADRFGLWLEVLMESGVEVAAEKVAGLDAGLVVAALAQHLRVVDVAASGKKPFDCEIGGYAIHAKRTVAWDAIVALLIRLDADHPAQFTRIMAGCRHLSNDGFELDGLHNLMSDAKQDLYDLAVARDERREKQGYVAPADARAFLDEARRYRHGAAPPPNAAPVAYFRALEPSAPPDDPPADEGATVATAAIMDVLVDEGVIAPPPRALLMGEQGKAPRLARIQPLLESGSAMESLAFLANVLLAGCSLQGRPFTQVEATEAAAAVCNLGLEGAGDIGDDVIAAFQIGWATLHRDVAMFTAARLIAVLGDLRCTDKEIQKGLDTLRLDLKKHLRDSAPWRASSALDIVMALDSVAWAALVGLIAECPVMHAALDASRTAKLLRVSPSDFEFISERGHFARVREFLDALPDALRR